MQGALLPAGFAGFWLGLSLIVAIGAQNAFILRQGLARQHVFILCLICALSDAILIAAGVGGLGAIVSRSPLLVAVATLGGAAFLFAYALFAFARALRPKAMTPADDGNGASLGAAIAACLAFTFLNPHVYLDTVVLLGALSATWQGSARVAFGAGAGLASFVWFFGLGYGARLLAPLFARPGAWRVLDAVIGVIMLTLAGGLLVRYLAA